MADQQQTAQYGTLNKQKGRLHLSALFLPLLRTAILLGLAVYFASLVFSGDLKNYSNQPVWLVLAASAMFLVLGTACGTRALGAAGLSQMREAAQLDLSPEYQHGHGHSHDLHPVHARYVAETTHAHGHSRSPYGWVVPVILSVPLLVGTLLPSQPLGAAAMGGNPASVPSVQRNGPPVPEPQAWNVKEWQMAMEHKVHPQSWFDGQKADVVGFVVRPSDIPAGDFLAARFVMYHCAADAQGVAMLVKWKDGTKIPEDTWVRVQGTVHMEQINGGPALRLHADSVDTSIGEPDSPYLAPLLRHDQPAW